MAAFLLITCGFASFAYNFIFLTVVEHVIQTAKVASGSVHEET